jgi:hypothetical protein
MSVEEGATIIYDSIEKALGKKEGLLVGRNGTIELEALFFRLYGSKPHQPYPEGIAARLELHAGIWPKTLNSIDRWVFMLIEAIRDSDVLVTGWYAPLKDIEEVFLKTTNTNGKRIPLRALEPYYVEPSKRWTNLLKGNKVAIVNAFADTAVAQTKQRELIWPAATDSLLPSDVEWIPIRTGYAPILAEGSAEWQPTILSWDVAVTDVVKRVVKSGAKIVLIGCGGLGMLIGCELRRRGLIAIVMGGATQVLFGIKGNRWAKHDVIQHFWNDSWVYPSVDETPQGSGKIEGGCYWGVKN